MHASILLIDRLKRELRAQKLGYAHLAERLGLSTASVKRMFAQRNFDLRRLDAICEVLGIDFASLAQEIASEQPLVSQLDWKQEHEIVHDERLFTVAVCALNLTPFEEIIALYRIEAHEAIACLLRLDRMGFLRLLPNNRYRLLVTRTFHWIADGPILRYFRSQADDYLSRPFNRTGETVRVVNVRISATGRIKLLERVEALVREYSAQHNADSSLPGTQRLPMSLLVAARAWEPAFMRRLRRDACATEFSSMTQPLAGRARDAAVSTLVALRAAEPTTGSATASNRQPDWRCPDATAASPERT